MSIKNKVDFPDRDRIIKIGIDLLIDQNFCPCAKDKTWTCAADAVDVVDADKCRQCIQVYLDQKAHEARQKENAEIERRITYERNSKN